jgi:predicted TIM-barrel fold metal-dependent hydrolase
MPEPWRSHFFPGPERYFYPAPISEFRPDFRTLQGHAGSDPDLLSIHLFDGAGIDGAILIPQTRGLNPELDLGSAICAAINDWLAEEWLAGQGGRLYGSIRVNAADPIAAVTEIQRWKDDSQMVQIAVTMQAHQPYGKRSYHPIWEAAADANLPVAILADGSAGVEFFPSPVGYFRHHIEYSSFYPLNFYYHLSSFIAEGVFEWFPKLRVIFADGGSDLLMPFIWRMNNNWRAVRGDTPWITHLPSDYLVEHVRFCASRLEGPTDSADLAEWLQVSMAADLQMYGSHYPFWNYGSPDQVVSSMLPDKIRERILHANASRFYGI